MRPGRALAFAACAMLLASGCRGASVRLLTFSPAPGGRSSPAATLPPEVLDVLPTHPPPLILRSAAPDPTPTPRPPRQTPTPRPEETTPPPTPTPAPREVSLREGDDGRRVDLQRGDILVVTLYECCESRWDYESPRPDGAILTEFENTSEGSSSDLRPHVWRFRATGAGSTVVKLLYAQQGSSEPPKNRWSAEINVTG